MAGQETPEQDVLLDKKKEREEIRGRRESEFGWNIKGVLV